MPLRGPQQYIDSLKDGRAVYYRGERVEDVTAHPVFKVAVQHAAISHRLAEDPRHRELASATDPDSGQSISRLYRIPREVQDLMARADLIELATRVGGTIPIMIKEIGSDALFSLHAVASQMDQSLGAGFLERVRAFYRHCIDNDLAVAVAQTDPKGDRSLRPSEQEQPDSYLRIVHRSGDGVVVRGAKLHTSTAINSNEVIVLPTRHMEERDRNYAVAFAVPLNTPGLKMLASGYTSEHTNAFEFPLSSKHRMIESMIIFDDVFVPRDRLFLDGQYQFAGPLALRFADFLRFTAVACKGPLLDLLVGSALLMADYNGIARAGHVREKLTWLMGYAQTVKGLLRMAAQRSEVLPPGIAVPDRLYTNVAKLHFASNYHTALGYVQDLAGGLLVTSPGEEALRSPETGESIIRYLGGRRGVSAEERLRAIHMVADLTTSELGGYHALLAIHGEGSIEAEKLAIFREYDAASAIAYAKEIAALK